MEEKMKTKMLLVFVAFLIILQVVGTAGAASCNPSGADFKVLSAVWGNSTHPVSAGPGNMGVPLTVTLQGYGTNCDIIGVNGTLRMPVGYTNPYNGSTSVSYHIDQIAPESISTMVFYVNIAKTVSASPTTVYGFTLDVYFNYTNNTNRNSQALGITMPMRGSVAISYGISNRNIIAGEINNVTVQVMNSGSGYVDDFITSVPSSSSLNILGQPSEIVSLPPYSTRNVTMQIYIPPSSSGGTVPLSLKSYYTNPYGYNTSANYTLDLYAVSPSQGTVSALLSPLTLNITPTTIVPGQITMLTFSFTNRGNATLNNLSVQTPTLGSERGTQFVGYTPIKIDYIKPHSTVNITENIYTNSTTILPLNVTVKFLNGTRLEQVVENISLLSGGIIYLAPSSISTIPATVSPGGIFSVSFIITDTGTTGISNASASAVLPLGFSSYGTTSSDYVGSIQTETPTPFSLTLKTNESLKSGIYTIPVKVNYLGNFRQSLSTTVNVSVVVAESALQTPYNSSLVIRSSATNSKKHSSLYVLIGTLVLVLAAIFTILYRRRRRLKSSKKVR